ncbi:TspO/MBR family protein [Methanoculleus frigidifontis]|nr:TspO/MBR family protein [Methanoculleus sp. FWC-SCC1]
MPFTKILKFIAAIAVCQAAGLIGTIFTTPAIPTWYAALTKPDLTPPSWVFGPVWTILYLLMGIALYLVWLRGWEKRDVKVAMSIFGVQLVLNVLWSYFFFGLQMPSVAFIEIIILWIAIALSIWSFARVSVPAAILLVPYIIWVSFAAYLTYAISVLNP